MKYTAISLLKRFWIKILLPTAIFVIVAYTMRWLEILRPAVFPFPHEILSKGVIAMQNQSSVIAIAVTLRRLCIAFFVSLALGGIMTFLFNQFKILAEIFALPIDIIRSIPIITLFPLFISLWGFSETTFLAVPVVLTTVILYVYLSAGLDNIAGLKQMLMKNWKASKKQMVFHLYLPSIAPQIFIALRISISLQLILLLVGEMFLGAKNGIGTLIYEYQSILKYEEMYFFIIIAGIFGYIINYGLKFIQKKVIYWQEINHD